MSSRNSHSIAIVCSRNLARSVFLEKYLANLYPNFKFSSFGTSANEGEMVPEHIQAISDSWGLDVKNHYASNLKLNLDEFQKADLIISAISRSALDAYLPKGNKIPILELTSRDIHRKTRPHDPFGGARGVFKVSSKWSELQLAKTLLSGKFAFESFFPDLRVSANNVFGFISSGLRLGHQIRIKSKVASKLGPKSKTILLCSSFAHARYWVHFFPDAAKFYLDFQSNSLKAHFLPKIEEHFGIVLLIQDREPLDEAKFLLGSEFQAAVQSLENIGDVILLPPPNYAKADSNPETFLRALHAKVIL